jgi:hypothetical protein
MRFACAAESIAKDSTFLHAEERDDEMLRLLKKIVSRSHFARVIFIAAARALSAVNVILRFQS